MPGFWNGRYVITSEILAARAASRQAAEAGAGPGLASGLPQVPFEGMHSSHVHQVEAGPLAEGEPPTGLPQQPARVSSPAGSAASSAFVRVHQQATDWPLRVEDSIELHQSRGLHATAAVQAAFGSAIAPSEPTRTDPESDTPDSSAGAQPAPIEGDPRAASLRKAYAWPAQKATDDDREEGLSPRSATSTVVPRTFSASAAEGSRS